MKTIKSFIAWTLLGTVISVGSSQAQDFTNAPPPATSSRDNASLDYPPLYHSQELDVDLFGSGSLGQETLEHFSGDRFRHRSLWGGGGGLTYFFTRYIGVGGEFDAEDRSERFVDSADGNVFLRVPILQTGLAPYIFGGGGYQFEDFRQSFGQAGGGLEFRFCRHWGIFVDGRYVIADQSQNFAEARAGFRFAF